MQRALPAAAELDNATRLNGARLAVRREATATTTTQADIENDAQAAAQEAAAGSGDQPMLSYETLQHSI
jgi:hypothetical protein